MDILIGYDINTQDKEGQRRLRQIANICSDFGQRVQYSLFECSLTRTQLEDFIDQLISTMNAENDSLRIYILRGNRDDHVHVFGIDRYVDFEKPLVL